MAGSPLSLDSLSSPSPSPSPPPAGKKQLPATNKSTIHKDPPTGPALDSDSELSELTEDDQDGTAPADRRERPTTSAAVPAVAPSKVSAPSGTASAVPPAAPSINADGHGNTAATSSRNQESAQKRGTYRTKYNFRRGFPRKKRSSIVPAPMWGWAETKANASSAPVEEEEEEMAGPPRAMEEEEEEPDEPEEEEEDDSDNRDHSPRPDDEDGGFVSQRRMGPYVTQRLPGIRSIYSGSGRGKHGRRQIPVSSRKLDADDPEPPINGVDHENGSASGSEYNSPKKKRPVKTRPPASAGSRKKKGESSGSDIPPPSRRSKKIQRQDEEDDGVESDTSSHKSDDENTKDDDVKISPKVSVSPPKFLPSSKPLSAIATSTINTAAAALAALAVIADSVENTAETLDFKGPTIIPSPPISRKSPTHAPPSLAMSTSSGIEAPPAASRSRTASPDNSDRDELTEPQPTYRNRRPTRRAPPRSKKPSDDWRRLVKPPVRSPNSKKPSIDLKINTSLNNTPDEPVVESVTADTEEMEVDPDPDPDDSNDAEKNDDADPDMEEDEADEEVSQQDDEPQPTEDAEEGDDEPVDPEGEGEGDEDPEQDLETNEVENEQENENENEEEENEEEPLADGELEDQEIELQPAHRAEALDVLASIELKFAMLRERVYVEKMEILAWEDSMVQASVHPEMQYLQKEMTKRRDKRLELASRKRSYEVINATKRRKADEDGVWSWWKLTVDELQTEMIAETNRKRRKLERERRALERPQPIRRIPLPPTDLHLLPQPSLRKLLKTYPFGVPKPMKRRRHRHSRIHQPKNLVYPEIPTLSVMDINHDLEFLYQNRRIPSSYDMPFGGPPPLWGQAPPFSHRSGLGTPGGLPGLGRPVGMGLGPSNGTLPSVPQNQAVVGLLQPNLQHHPYEQYPEVSSYGGSRLRDVYTHGPAPPALAGSRDPYVGYSGHSTRNHPSPSHPSTPNIVGTTALGYPSEHEMGAIPTGGHQIVQNPPYFGHANPGPPPTFPPSSSHGNKGVSNGRRSPPSPPHMSNGMPNSKPNGGWMNPSTGMGSFQIGSSSGKGGDREARTVHDDDERDRLVTRDRDRKRAERDNMERRDYWDKDYPDPDRDRTRDISYIHPTSIPYGHSSGAPTPGPGVDGHHHSSHHHRNHHHHVLHRHGPPHPPSSLPSPVHPGSGGAPPIVHSPRSTRDYDMPGSSSVPHPTTDGIMLSSGNKSQLLPREREREREREYQWSQRNMDAPIQHSPSMIDYRDRDKDFRKPYSHRPSSRPGPIDDRNDHPTSSPFVMAPASISSVPPPLPPSSHMNGSGIGNSDSSHKGQTIWTEDPSYRMPPAGYMGSLSSHEAHRSPIQAHRYTPGAPPGRLPPASSIHRMVSPPPSIRSRPPPSPYSHSSGLHRSPPTSPRLPPRSPISTKPLLASGRTVTPTGQRPPSSHTPSGHPPLPPLDSHLKNGTTTNYPVGGRTESPHMSALHPPSTRQGLNGNGGLGDVDRHPMSTLSPRLGHPVVGLHPSKLSATPVMDRR